METRENLMYSHLILVDDKSQLLISNEIFGFSMEFSPLYRLTFGRPTAHPKIMTTGTLCISHLARQHSSPSYLLLSHSHTPSNSVDIWTLCVSIRSLGSFLCKFKWKLFKYPCTCFLLLIPVTPPTPSR